MKKPISKFAILMWAAAVVVAVLNAVEVWTVVQNMRGVAEQAGEAYLAVGTVLRAAGGVIAPTVLLIGFGALIELVDQIRWNTRPKD